MIVYWAARMLIADLVIFVWLVQVGVKLSISLCLHPMTSITGHTWSVRLVMENVAPWRRSSVGLMTDRTGRHSGE